METDIQKAARLLQAGEVVALPTETVYGLAGHALDTAAVNKIFAVKNRPLIDPLIVHVYDMEGLKRIAEPLPLLEPLLKAFWPGPLTLVLPKRPAVPELVTAGKPTVAVRMPGHPLFREVLKASGLPLAAPSANPFGYLSPSRAEHVADSLGERVPFILDGGPCAIGIESTILDLTAEAGPTILRPGPITQAALEAVLGTPVHMHERKAHTGTQSAPGMLEQHYSPHTPLSLFEPGAAPAAKVNEASIFMKRPAAPGAHTYWLSESGDLEEAARNLFDLLRSLDSQNFTHLYLELPQAEGIGVALRDRLNRAAAKGR